jgi:hypothetical protein
MTPGFTALLYVTMFLITLATAAGAVPLPVATPLIGFLLILRIVSFARY